MTFLFSTPEKFFRRLVLVFPWAIAGCGTEPAPVSIVQEEQVVKAATFVVEPVAWPSAVRCQGSLFADETTTVSARVAGRVQAVMFEVGDKATPGEILVEIDEEEYQLQAEQADAQLAQARAAIGLKLDDSLDSLNPDNAPPVREARAVLDEAVKSLARVESLAGSLVVTDNDRELAIAAEQVAAARLSSAQNGVREKIALIGVQTALRGLAHQRLNDTKVRAPFEGFVQTKSVAVGTYVQAGQPLLTLVRNQKLRFRSSVPEKYAHELRIGQKVTLSFDLSRQHREGTISRISPNLDPMSRSLGFEVDIDNSDQSLRSGLFGEGVVELDPDSRGIALPLETIQRFAGVDKVWKVVDGQVKEQVVLVGGVRDGMVEIRSGIEMGDVLLTSGDQGRSGRWVSGDSSATEEPAAD